MLYIEKVQGGVLSGYGRVRHIDKLIVFSVPLNKNLPVKPKKTQKT